MRVALVACTILATFHVACGFDINAHRIKGMMAAVYTPMKGQYGLELDLDKIPAYAKFLAARNVTNIMPAGSNGESLSLTVPERKLLAEAWAKAAAPLGLKVYMHIGSESVVDSRDLAAHAAQVEGIHGILAMAPVYFKPTLQTLHDFVAAIASAAPTTPFWFYHFPDDTGVQAGNAHKFLEMADQSKMIPNLMGIKYTDYNMMDFSLCMQVGGEYGKYNMLYGRDEQAYAALQLKADAAVSSTINYAPSLREVVSLFARGEQAAALAQQAKNADLCTLFGAYESQAQQVQKNILRMAGMDVGPSRLPKTDLSESDYAALKFKLNQLGLIDKAPETSAASSRPVVV